ncbi:MAG: hypothetical protein KAQ92_01145, partial [Candidatus Aenigmarchaeota archaeon]|nr:hypothetical protein [Candidatus Aenigmarchaeota archaeon]
SENYREAQQYNCICTPLDVLEKSIDERNEKCKDNCIDGICQNILCLKKESSCTGKIESCQQEWIIKIANTQYYMTIFE